MSFSGLTALTFIIVLFAIMMVLHHKDKPLVVMLYGILIILTFILAKVSELCHLLNAVG